MTWCPNPSLVGIRRLILVTRTLVKSNPQHCTLQCKKSCGIKVGFDLFRLVSVLGGGSSLVGGRVQFSSLLLRTDQTNT